MEFKDKALVEKIQAEEQEKQIQQKLKEKHGIEDENVVVVEKFSLTKFLIKTFVILVKTVISASLLALAALGLIAILYTEVREPLFEIIRNGFYML